MFLSAITQCWCTVEKFPNHAVYLPGAIKAIAAHLGITFEHVKVGFQIAHRPVTSPIIGSFAIREPALTRLT